MCGARVLRIALKKKKRDDPHLATGTCEAWYREQGRGETRLIVLVGQIAGVRQQILTANLKHNVPENGNFSVIRYEDS